MSALRTSILRALRISDPTPDAVLVRSAAAGDDDAFQALVSRHGPMVLRVCRQILADEHESEDAFQATFLLFARRARQLRRPERVAAWLFGTARRIALKARKSIARRRGRETKSAVRTLADPVADPTARELFAALDEEVERLPEVYRLPLLLCYWQGLTQEESARRLGWSAGSVKGRLERGRKMLAGRLAKRGLAPSALLALSAAKMSVSADLVAKTGSLAVKGALVPASVAALVAGSGFMKGASAMAITVFVASVGLFSLAGWTTPTALKPDDPGSPKQAPATPSSMRIIVLDPDGKPLAGANIHTGIWTHEKGFKSNHDYATNAAGAAEIELPKTFYILRIWASKKPFTAMFAGWEQAELTSGQWPPNEYTFRLEETVTAGGRVERGSPRFDS